MKRQVPITAHEVETYDELKAIRNNQRDFEEEIRQVNMTFTRYLKNNLRLTILFLKSKVLLNRIDNNKTEKSQLALDENWINQMKVMLKNQ